MAAQYDFEFISNYQGVSHYRIRRNGYDGGRLICDSNSRTLSYSDGSGATQAEVDAFNAKVRADWSHAIAKHGNRSDSPIPVFSAKREEEEEGESDLIARAIARLDAETSDDSFGKWGEEDVERLSREIAADLGLSVSFDEYFNPTFSVKEESI